MKKNLFTNFIFFNSLTYGAQELKNSITLDVAPLMVKPSRISLGFMRNIDERWFVDGELDHPFSKILVGHERNQRIIILINIG